MRSTAGANCARKLRALDERSTLRLWPRPLPHERRVPDFPHCGPCFASFMLDNDTAWHSALGQGVFL